MVGQTALISSLRSMVDTRSFPRTLLLEGPWGCGKHTLAQEIASWLSLTFKDITESLNLETLESIQLAPTPCLYLIDASSISVKEQNTILKFLEEPLQTSYIVVLCESRHKLLNTVLNRCFIKTFEGYTSEELQEFWGDDSWSQHTVSRYADTPGRVLQMKNSDPVASWELVNKVLQKVRVATYANILSIPGKFYYKEAQEGKLDFNLFIYLLSYAALDNYNQGSISFKTYELVNKFVNELAIPNINKSNLFEHFLIVLKREMCGEVL